MPATRSTVILAALLAAFAATHANAQRGAAPDAPRAEAPPEQPQAQPAQQRAAPDVPMAELVPLLRRLERELDKQFIVDRRLGTRIYLGSLEPQDVTYPVLLSILRSQGFAAYESEGRINIVTDAEIRFAPTPIVQSDDDDSIAADSFVTRIVSTTNVEAAQLIPILRPLMSQAAHLAAVGPSKIVLVDRYGNTKRITAVIRALDTPARN